MNVRVQDGLEGFRPTKAESSNPNVLSVEELFETGVVVRGNAPGEAYLTVTRGSEEDAILIEVAEVGQTIIHLYPVGELAAGVKGLDTTEVVMTPRARVWGFVEQRDTSGQNLTGFGATPCEVDATEGGLVLNDNNDLFTLDAGYDTGQITLSCGETELILPVEEADAAVRLNGYDYLNRVEGPDFDSIAPGSRVYLVILAYDDQDRIVQGAAGEAVEVIIPEEYAPHVEVPDTAGSEELDAIMVFSRAIAIDFSTAGSYDVTATWQGLSADMSFDVTAAQ